MGESLIFGKVVIKNSLLKSELVSSRSIHEVVLQFFRSTEFRGGIFMQTTKNIKQGKMNIIKARPSIARSLNLKVKPFVALLFLVNFASSLSIVSYTTDSDGVTFACKFNSSQSTTYQAESAALSGGAKVETEHSGYTGSGFVGGYYNSPSAKTTFTVNVASSGNYLVQLTYAAGNGTSTSTGLSVNNGTVKNLTLSATSNWGTWATRTDTVSLNAGSNTVAYSSTQTSTASINLDAITISALGPSTENAGIMKIKICQPAIARVTYAPAASFPEKKSLVVLKEWQKPQFTVSEAGDIITLTTSRMKAKVSKSTAAVTFTDLSDNVILSEYEKSMTPTTVEGEATYTVNTSYHSPTDEALYGLGIHMINSKVGKTIMNYKGQNETMEQLYDQYKRYTSAVPVLISSKGYGLFWDNYSLSKFYGGEANNTRYSYSSEAGALLDYYFFYGPSIDTVISLYRTTTGKAPLLPKWSYGLIQSKDRYESQAEMLAVKNGYRNNKIPVDAIVLDWKYWYPNPWGSLLFNTGLFPNPKALVDSMHSTNIHTMISIWTSYEKGSANYTALENVGGLWPTKTNFSLVDAYSAAGRALYWNQLSTQRLIADGWDSWFCDATEPDPWQNNINRHAVQTAMGKGAFFYNTYSLMIMDEGYTGWRRDIPGKRVSILTRSAFAGQQRSGAITWNNDISSDFASLVNSIPAGLNFQLTGNPNFTTDIGGYWGHNYDWSTPGHRELFIRWFQYGVFNSIFRIHGGGSRELYSSNWDATTKSILHKFNHLRYRLLPYIYSLAWKTTHEDYTMQRHLIMDFRTDANVHNIGDQFMFGPALLVSPVVDSAERISRAAYIPAGTWYDFWTGATVTGGSTQNFAAPLDKLPLHVRAGSIIPMGPIVQHANERSDSIEVRVYPGANGQFTIYEDEGDNYNYESGKYATIPILYDNGTGKVTIGARSGSYNGMQTNKVFSIVFVRAGHGVDVGKTQVPDCVINYSGNAVTSECMNSVSVGVLPKQKSLEYRVKQGTEIYFPANMSHYIKNIQVYTLSGKFLKTVKTSKNKIDIKKDLGVSLSVCIIKVKFDSK